jgi:hypothetical protein
MLYSCVCNHADIDNFVTQNKCVPSFIGWIALMHKQRCNIHLFLYSHLCFFTLMNFSPFSQLCTDVFYIETAIKSVEYHTLINLLFLVDENSMHLGLHASTKSYRSFSADRLRCWGRRRHDILGADGGDHLQAPIKGSSLCIFVGISLPILVKMRW